MELTRDKSFREVCKALIKIRDKKLYREQYLTFDEYCRDRWKFTEIQFNDYVKTAQSEGLL